MKIRLDDDYELKTAWLRCTDSNSRITTRVESVEIDGNLIIFQHSPSRATILELPIQFTRFRDCGIYWFLAAWLEKHRPELFL